MKRCVLMLVGVAIACSDDKEIAGPPPVQAGPEFIVVETGHAHTCALTLENDVYCWGSGEGGELGDFRAASSAVPVKTDGTTRFVDLSVGAQHTCGVDTNGFVHCWGNNVRGQLGNGTHINLGTPVPITNLTRFAHVSAGSFHTCAATAAGAVFCWGAGTQGQLGTAAMQDVTSAQRVSTSQAFTQLTAGAHHTCALRADGAAYCWGANHAGQLGDGTQASGATPRAVAGNLRFTMLSAGNAHTCGVEQSGVLYCWGSNENGELGHDPADVRWATSPLAVPAGVTMTSVSAGERTTCAAEVRGRAWCWGSGGDGQLGDDRGVSRSAPQPIARGRLLAGDSIQRVSTALAHTCAVTARHAVYCWGANQHGQLGTGGTAGARSAVRISWSGP